MANEHEFAAAFDQVLGSGGPVTVDMRQLRFMDSSGIKATRPKLLRTTASSCTAFTIRYRKSWRSRIEQLPGLHVVPCTVGTS